MRPIPNGETRMYQLGSRSKQRLVGVHPRLAAVAARAIALSTQDFTVLEGVRTLERQKVLKAQGASQTLDSRHLKQADGYGHAVDLAAWVDGQVAWDPWSRYVAIADAVRRAAIELDTPVRWGGGWFNLNGLASLQAVAKASTDYVAERRAAGRKAFLDGPHFELPAGFR